MRFIIQKLYIPTYIYVNKIKKGFKYVIKIIYIHMHRYTLNNIVISNGFISIFYIKLVLLSFNSYKNLNFVNQNASSTQNSFVLKNI